MTPSPSNNQETEVDDNIKYGFIPQQCWNSEIKSIPARKITEYSYAGQPTNVKYKCDNSDYPYLDYNEAVAKYNEIKLKHEYIQNDHHLRALKLKKENEHLNDRQNVAIERVRLKDEQQRNITSTTTTILRIIYYIMLALIIIRITISMYNNNTLFSNGNVMQSSLFLFFSLLLLTIPLYIKHASQNIYVTGKRWITPRHKELGLRPDQESDAPNHTIAQPLIQEQRQVIHDIDNRPRCWFYNHEKNIKNIQENKNIHPIELLHSSDSNESCRNDNNTDPNPNNEYCWGIKTYCNTIDNKWFFKLVDEINSLDKQNAITRLKEFPLPKTAIILERIIDINIDKDKEKLKNIIIHIDDVDQLYLVQIIAYMNPNSIKKIIKYVPELNERVHIVEKHRRSKSYDSYTYDPYTGLNEIYMIPDNYVKTHFQNIFKDYENYKYGIIYKKNNNNNLHLWMKKDINENIWKKFSETNYNVTIIHSETNENISGNPVFQIHFTNKNNQKDTFGLSITKQKMINS